MSPKAASPSPQMGASFHSNLRLSVEYASVAALTIYHRHAHTHTTRQIERIAASVQMFGFVSPLIIDQNGVILAGHGRLAAAKLLGYDSVPVVRLEHLDEPQKKALRLADNQLAALAGWDEEILALEFKDLLALELSLDLEFDLTITGFEAAEIDKLIDAKGASEEEKDEAAVPAPETVAVSLPGDLWLMDAHRIFCGNALDTTSYGALLAGETAAMGIHDFPYNVRINGHVSSTGKHPEFLMACGEMSPAEFTGFLADALQQTSAVLRPGALQYAFMDWRHMGEMLTAGQGSGQELLNLCVWNKGCGGMGSLYRSQHELVFVFKTPGAAHQNNVRLGRFGRNRTNVWDVPGGAAALRTELELHSTPKPVVLIAEAIRDASSRNDIVLDAFGGSGTTIIAAAKAGRRARVIELDPLSTSACAVGRTGQVVRRCMPPPASPSRRRWSSAPPRAARRRPTSLRRRLRRGPRVSASVSRRNRMRFRARSNLKKSWRPSAINGLRITRRTAQIWQPSWGLRPSAKRRHDNSSGRTLISASQGFP